MKKINEEQMANLALELNAVRDKQLADVGQNDANYIRKIIKIQRSAEIIGRIFIVSGFISPFLWVFGVLALSLSKILDNMEIGHNVLHGQYDWMNDPYINSQQFEWDIACDAASWRRVHNYEHHTYTNIIGKDRDFGYGLLRLSNDYPWRLKNLWQSVIYVILSVLFQWGISFHELAGERVFFGKKKANRQNKTSDEQLKKAFFSKGARQIVKDYILFPVLAGPFFLWVLVGNLAANIIRNLWTSTIIFCGHFTSGSFTFTEQECENESKGHWYYRQMLGSANINGGKIFHILTGHLSFQVEHHLFPDIPAHRYVAISKDVKQIAKKYDIPYNTGSFTKQYFSVLKRVFYFSFPVKDDKSLYPKFSELKK